MSVTIKNMLDDLGEDEDAPIPLPNVSALILEKVIAYCTHHKDDPPSEDDTDKKDPIHGWDLEFTKVDQATLFEMTPSR